MDTTTGNAPTGADHSGTASFEELVMFVASELLPAMLDATSEAVAGRVDMAALEWSAGNLRTTATAGEAHQLLGGVHSLLAREMVQYNAGMTLAERVDRDLGHTDPGYDKLRTTMHLAWYLRDIVDEHLRGYPVDVAEVRREGAMEAVRSWSATAAGEVLPGTEWVLATALVSKGVAPSTVRPVVAVATGA